MSNNQYPTIQRLMKIESNHLNERGVNYLKFDYWMDIEH